MEIGKSGHFPGARSDLFRKVEVREQWGLTRLGGAAGMMRADVG